MRVGLDLTALDSSDLFPARFSRALIRHLPQVEFVVFTSGRGEHFVDWSHLANARLVNLRPARYEPVVRRLTARLPVRVAHQVRRVMPTLRPPRGRADVLFAPFTPARVADRNVPLVAAIHDVSHVTSPHLLTSRQRATRALAMDTTLTHATKLVCSADSVRDALAAHAVEVQTIRPAPLLIEPKPSPGCVSEVLARFGLEPGSFLLMPSGDEPRHNAALIFAAFALLHARDPHNRLKLVCAARDGDPFQRMGLGPDVVLARDNMTREDRVVLTSAAKAVVVASLYETIGEDLLQAMAFGTPVICSSLPELVDLVADAALMFDPHRPAELVAALKNEPSRAEYLRHAGPARVAALDEPATVAERYATMLREARCQRPFR